MSPSTETDQLEVTADGGKQTLVHEDPTELPPRALLEISRIMCEGAKKYGTKNWHSISTKGNLKHAIRHWLLYQELSEYPTPGHQHVILEELAHFATRALMALDQYIRTGDTGEQGACKKDKE